MFWSRYVFRRGVEVDDMWDAMFRDRAASGRPVKIAYITGSGFDVRSQTALTRFVSSVKGAGCDVNEAKLMSVSFKGYELSEELHALTAENVASMRRIFEELGETLDIEFGADDSDDDIGATATLRMGVDQVLKALPAATDIILDASSLPRIAYLSIMLALLAKIVPEDGRDVAKLDSDVTLHVVVAEDAKLDGAILAEDPADDLVLVPGYSLAMQAEAMQDLSLIWFPILGENRVGQMTKVAASIPDLAEICPVVPHPSRNLRRGDDLLIEYRSLLFDQRATPVSNVLYAHEHHPFEAYRQMLGAMQRYRSSLELVGGCRMALTPLASKLITIGAGLACFEMKRRFNGETFSVAIPCAQPRRYSAPVSMVRGSQPELSALVLTGDPYVVGSQRTSE